MPSPSFVQLISRDATDDGSGSVDPHGVMVDDPVGAGGGVEVVGEGRAARIPVAIQMDSFKAIVQVATGVGRVLAGTALIQRALLLTHQSWAMSLENRNTESNGDIVSSLGRAECLC